MKPEEIQKRVRRGQYYIYKHARIEADKEGIETKDMKSGILNGEMIEEYPDRKRFLFYGRMDKGLPIHVICDYSEEKIAIVTTYIPQDSEWINYQIRRKR